MVKTFDGAAVPMPTFTVVQLIVGVQPFAFRMLPSTRALFSVTSAQAPMAVAFVREKLCSGPVAS